MTEMPQLKRKTTNVSAKNKSPTLRFIIARALCVFYVHDSSTTGCEETRCCVTIFHAGKNKRDKSSFAKRSKKLIFECFFYFGPSSLTNITRRAWCEHTHTHIHTHIIDITLCVRVLSIDIRDIAHLTSRRALA